MEISTINQEGNASPRGGNVFGKERNAYLEEVKHFLAEEGSVYSRKKDKVPSSPRRGKRLLGKAK